MVGGALYMVIYPAFYTWHKEAINTKSGLIFAPEDFYIVKRREHLLTDDGCAGSETHRKTFFTGDEALELEKKVLMPNGWRLPTKDDWQAVCDEFRTPGRLKRKLKLTLNGYIDYDEMGEYNQKLEANNILGLGPFGYFWSSTEFDKASMYCMGIGNSLIGRFLGPTVAVDRRDYGYSIRCVAREYWPF